MQLNATLDIVMILIMGLCSWCWWREVSLPWLEKTIFKFYAFVFGSEVVIWVGWSCRGLNRRRFGLVVN